MIQRNLKPAIEKALKTVPVVTITGPRQSGKTTLAKSLGADWQYVNLEYPDVREHAATDPRGFLSTYAKTPLIIDEAQYLPELFSYIQGIVDERGVPGQFVLTGSQNFNLSERISQSLAGRTMIFNLLPLSHSELIQSGIELSLNELIFKGGYPRLYDAGADKNIWMRSYIQTYVERDVRQLINIHNLDLFIRFVRLCAGRIGQLINYSSLATECGIDVKTAQSWLGLLETSFIAFTLKPYHRNFNKRLVKSPKLYFYDTGLATNLLGLENGEQLDTFFLKGGLFENWVILELLKKELNQGKQPQLYFWRDSTGQEIDLLIEKVNGFEIAEIKSSQTFRTDFLKGINAFKTLVGDSELTSKLFYAGEIALTRDNTHVTPWKNISAGF